MSRNNESDLVYKEINSIKEESDDSDKNFDLTLEEIKLLQRVEE